MGTTVKLSDKRNSTTKILVVALISFMAMFSFNANAKTLTNTSNHLSLTESTIRINASTIEEVKYGYVACTDNVSTTQYKTGSKKVTREAYSNTFSFYHNEKVEIDFAMTDKNIITYNWKVINSQYNEDLLGLRSIGGTENQVAFLAENISDHTQSIQIEVTPIYKKQGLNNNAQPTIFTIEVYPQNKPSFESNIDVFSGNEYAIVEYQTQVEKDDYRWSFSGIKDVDYTIVSGGTCFDDNVNIIWLTQGEKKVEVSYLDNGRYSQVPAASTINVTKLGQKIEVGDYYQGGIVYEVYGTPGKQWGKIISKDDLVERSWHGEAMHSSTIDQICHNYEVSDSEFVYTNWYLPAIYELKIASKAVPELFKTTYWTSTESKAMEGHAITLSENGKVGMATKYSNNVSNGVKAVRKFSYKDKLEVRSDSNILATVK